MANNTQALENGFTKARHLIDEYKRKALIRGGQALVESFLKRFRTYRGSIGLTGNTFSGTAVGCYMRGQLYAVISSQDMVGEPLRKKRHKGETVINFVDINGKLRRKFTATVNTTDETSYDTAMRFLQSHRPSIFKFSLKAFTSLQIPIRYFFINSGVSLRFSISVS